MTAASLRDPYGRADREFRSSYRQSPGWLYRKRGSVEREFGRLKHEWAMRPLRVRRIERVKLHVDRSILARLAVALDMARSTQEAHPLSLVV